VTAAGPATPNLDIAALSAWMDRAGLPGTGVTPELMFISGGSQNEIYEVRRGDLHAALRIPPATAPGARDAGILREWRIIDALAASDVPHPPAVAVCAQSDVLGRPFYLMGYVDGWSPMTSPQLPAPFVQDPDSRVGLAHGLIDGVMAMGAFDWRAAGLGDLGRPDGFHDRQVGRWTGFLERIRGRPLPGYEEATRWLSTRRPLDFVPGLMHGDYQFANVMYHWDAPARLAAIVDWEMGTIGDPKLDLAWALQGWPEDTSRPGSAFTYIDIQGMPGRSALLERYAHSSGRQVDDFDYYLVLARWKLAIVLEQGYQRAGGDPKLASFGSIVLDLMARAAELAGSSSYGRR
jgi:aminoglycoside phosphotransferase (APT) family kinase protein